MPSRWLSALRSMPRISAAVGVALGVGVMYGLLELTIGGMFGSFGFIGVNKHHSGCKPDNEGQWAIGMYRGSSPFHLQPLESILPRVDSNAAWPVANPVFTCAHVTDVKSNFVADPFIWPTADHVYLFFESKSMHSNQGDIGLAESTDGGVTFRHVGIVLDEPWHLSYPFVFQHNSQMYLMPEGYKGGGLRLYKAVVFPTKWELEKVIIAENLVDASLVEWGGLLWIFATDQAKPSARGCRELEAWYSETPQGPWTPHPMNPLKAGVAAARCGGRPLVHQGKLYRFGQDCEFNYGHKLRSFHVKTLNTTDFEEEEVPLNYEESHKGTAAWNGQRHHHMDAHQLPSGEWIAAMDGDAQLSGYIGRQIKMRLAILLPLACLLFWLLYMLACYRGHYFGGGRLHDLLSSTIPPSTIASGHPGKGHTCLSPRSDGMKEGKEGKQGDSNSISISLSVDATARRPRGFPRADGRDGDGVIGGVHGISGWVGINGKVKQLAQPAPPPTFRGSVRAALVGVLFGGLLQRSQALWASVKQRLSSGAGGNTSDSVTSVPSISDASTTCGRSCCVSLRRVLLGLLLAAAVVLGAVSFEWHYRKRDVLSAVTHYLHAGDIIDPVLIDGQASKFTLLVMTYSVRRVTLEAFVKHYSRCPSVGEIVVVWNKGTPPDPTKDFDSAVPVRVRVEAVNSLNNRFRPDPLITTRAVLSLDDDLFMPCSDIERAFAKWRMHPERLTGFYGRMLEGEPPIYNCTACEHHMATLGKVNVLLTGAAFFDWDLLIKAYWEEANAPARAYVEQAFNCEDLLANFVMAKALRGRQYVEYVRPSKRFDLGKLTSKQISAAGHGFGNVRHECLTNFSAVHGPGILSSQGYQIDWDGMGPPWCGPKSIGCVY